MYLQNAHTALSIGILVKLDINYKLTEKPVIVYTGISKNFVRATDLESYLDGKTLTAGGLLDGTPNKALDWCRIT